MAPIQAIWAQDNRGVMVRVMGEAGDPATHLENRVGEPLGKPLSLHGIADLRGSRRHRPRPRPGPSADAPYRSSAEPLPATLAEALAALRTNVCFREGFGEGFVNYYAHIKEAEIARSRKEAAHKTEQGDANDWEHREYFDLL